MAPRSFRLCYITDRRLLPPESLPQRIRQAVQAGVDLVQVREKDLPTRELLGLVQGAVEAARGQGPEAARIVVNDRVDVALAVPAHGVHLGRQSMPTPLVRAMLPEGFLLGVSCHSLAEAREAESSRADYILLGPVFETPSKLAYGPPLGLGKLREVTSQVGVPVIALGGITVDRVNLCLENGAAGVAGIRLFQECESLEAMVQALRGRFSTS